MATQAQHGCSSLLSFLAKPPFLEEAHCLWFNPGRQRSKPQAELVAAKIAVDNCCSIPRSWLSRRTTIVHGRITVSLVA